ncbi:hypothetical protein Val02_20890 [Virgisporangium aliadipatigenens]|uniref:Uncharacterized protein n=1 Tax=Virgisporangium aliadipatigenens TaxID=741659 RepID=A0A8J3YJW6_9ACTN|nr:hypothetical protein [Virgisporangium aliadipatigenens]GIJ45203.1 hypothetical protein Val02_20890 [Virgisporangium aliadipatigenens]
MMEVVLSTAGALLGVALGAALTARAQTRVWHLGETARATSERRRVYADFLAAQRHWRAAVMDPDVHVMAASTFSRKPHADGGQAALDVLRLRMEIELSAPSARVPTAARDAYRATIALAEARAVHPAGGVPEEILERCRRAEKAFADVAREELGAGALWS